MIQIPEPLQRSMNETMMPPISPTMNVLNPMSIPQIMAPQLNMPLPGSFQIGVPVQMNNTPQNNNTNITNNNTNNNTNNTTNDQSK